MRVGFESGLVNAALNNTKIHVLTGDHGYTLFDKFRSSFPDRFHNVGVAEANLVGLASGMAKNGLRPLIYGLASFVPNRVFEFIKLQIALDALPVTIVGDGAGVVYSYLGRSHQTLEDLAIIGSLPQIRAISPASDEEMRIATEWALGRDYPVYLRMGKMGGSYVASAEGVEPRPYLAHKSQGGTRIALVSHGSMVSECLEAQHIGKVLPLDIWSCPTVFGVEAQFVRLLARDYSKVLIVEEHFKRGGLADELRRELASTDVKVESLSATAPDDHRVGSYDWAIKQHGVAASQIREFLEHKLAENGP